MLQCDAIMQGIRVEEAFDALHTSMDGRRMPSRGVQDDILQLTALVQWLRLSHTGNNAHKVLLGNCDLRCVPGNMRRMYMQLQLDEKLHNLWLQGCVGVIRAAWAAHDAQVADTLAEMQQNDSDGEPQAAEVQQVAPSHNTQDEVRDMVSAFCTVHHGERQNNHPHQRGGRMRRGANRPRRRVQSSAITGAEQSQQGAHGQLPPLSSLGELARRPPAQQQHNGTDSSTSDDEVGNRTTSTHEDSSQESLPPLRGLMDFVTRSSHSAQPHRGHTHMGRRALRHKRTQQWEATSTARTSGDVLDMMGITPQEATMAAASSDTQGQPTAQQALSNLTPAQERQIMTLGYLPGLQQHNGLYGPMDTSESSQDTQTPQQAAEVPQRHCNTCANQAARCQACSEALDAWGNGQAAATTARRGGMGSHR